MTTVTDLINLSLKDIGIVAVGETPSAEDYTDALTTLNQMIAQWKTSKTLTTGQHAVTFTATGAQVYTIGPSADIDVTLPVSVDAAFYRLNNIDYPCQVLTSFEDYENITLKTITGTLPSVVFFQRNSPTGNIYVWPQPSTGQMHLVVHDVLPTYTAIDDDLGVPDEYALAMRFSLDELLITQYSLPYRADIAKQAKAARKVIRSNNLGIPRMGQPQDLLRNGRFSIYTGQ